MSHRSAPLLCALAIGACSEPPEWATFVGHRPEATHLARDAGPVRPSGPEPAAPFHAPSTRTASVPATAELPAGRPGADRVIIPSGTLLIGSRPGAAGRNPTAEADLVPTTIGSFEIDRAPYPNRAGAPPRTDVSREEAARLCEERGQRLCTELEWERACKGDGDRSFAVGEHLDLERCALDPASCVSPFGVTGQGVGLYEWTSSDADSRIGTESRTAVLRGATLLAPDAEHRCASRRARTASVGASDIGFRCCRGAPGTVAPYPDEPPRPAVEDASSFDLDALRRALANNPATATWARDFALQPSAVVGRTLAATGHAPGRLLGWIADPAVVRWTPQRGDTLLVALGRVDAGAVVTAFHMGPDDHVRLSSAILLEGYQEGLALAHHEDVPFELRWAARWNEDGEEGSILRRDDATVVVTHR